MRSQKNHPLAFFTKKGKGIRFLTQPEKNGRYHLISIWTEAQATKPSRLSSFLIFSII
jgi:hypothetical protein